MIADTTLFVKDLPSKKFYNKVKEYIHYDEILKYARNNKIKNVKIWIDNFRERLDNYLKKETAEWNLIKPEIRCSDLNFIIDVIAERIEKSNLNKNVFLALNVLTISKELINRHSPIKCNRSFSNDIKDGAIFKRYFDNLCEDSSFIMSNIEKVKKGGKCKAIVKCGTNMAKILEGNFCAVLRGEMDSATRQNVKGSSAHPKGTLDVDQDREESEDHGAGEDIDNDMVPPLESLELELGNNEEPPDLNTTYAASTLLGTSLMAIILYKFKPFNSRIPSKNLRRTQIIPDAHDGESPGWLLNNFDYQEMNSDHHEYHMPYGAVNNL
ncbi:PIR protein [Plasmodium vivax]|uniref:VIR protein n=1 Tax=Plasmodium vivax TaxID=5855 RepID=A0A564ZVL2_PLAVI|nr:PIR protein [Plasmodium vivax]